MGNCDTHLVLAFRIPRGARVFSDRADALPSTLMATPIDRSWLFVRGRTPEQVERFRLEDHPLYGGAARGAARPCGGRDLGAGFSQRGAPAIFQKGRAPRDHGSKGPHPIGYGPLTIKRDALTAATTYGERGRTR